MTTFDKAPARVRNCVTHHGCACREYVMERLPNYQAAVEALERLADVAMIEEEDVTAATQDEWVAALNQAGAALARLRESVPA